MNKITVSAPGKLMLLGEHAVIYGYPCIVTAVDKRLTVTVEKKGQSGKLVIDPSNGGASSYTKTMEDVGKGDIPKGVRFIEVAMSNVFSSYPKILKRIQEDKLGITITTTSEFSSQFGFGSSSASTVAAIKALSEFFEIPLSDKDLFDLAYKTVLDIQQTGSGFDIAAAVYGGTLYFKKGGGVIEPLDISQIPLIVAYSGEKADTVSMVKNVEAIRNEDRTQVDTIFSLIGKTVEKAKEALLRGDLEAFGILLNQNQEYLFSLGVSIDIINGIIYAAVDKGAYGAKISGAGGGDSIIAVSPKTKENAVKQAITNNGGRILDVVIHAEGVRVES